MIRFACYDSYLPNGTQLKTASNSRNECKHAIPILFIMHLDLAYEKLRYCYRAFFRIDEQRQFLR